MKILLVVCVALSLVSGEKPAPYPPKGWKPQGARLELPPSRAYGTSLDARTVEFTTKASQADADDFLAVQGLPPAASAESQFQQFQQQQQQQQQLRQSLVMPPAPAFGGRVPLLLSPAFAPEFAAPSQQLREQQFGRQQAPPQQEYGAPSREYGPPEATTAEPEREDADEEESEEEQQQQPAIAVANAAQTRVLATTQQGQFGQYYVLLPDNSLQKVRFATGQSEDDRVANGFSAQLKYSPVEPIKDPVFGYDEQGKLVRLF